MASTLENLEARLTNLENQVASLQALIRGSAPRESLADQGARLLREAKASQVAASAAVAKAFAEMGIGAKAVSTEDLRNMMAASGVKAEDRLFSREIQAM